MFKAKNDGLPNDMISLTPPRLASSFTTTVRSDAVAVAALAAAVTAAAVLAAWSIAL